MHSTTRLCPDLLAEIEESMGKGRSDGCEGETIRNGKGGRDEQRAISFVMYLVEGGIGVDDASNVVGFAGVVEGSTRRDRHKFAIPSICILLWESCQGYIFTKLIFITNMDDRRKDP